MKPEKFVLKTFRIPSQFMEVLERDSGSNGITPNALMNQILKKYVSFDRYEASEPFILVPSTFLIQSSMKLIRNPCRICVHAAKVLRSASLQIRYLQLLTKQF